DLDPQGQADDARHARAVRQGLHEVPRRRGERVHVRGPLTVTPGVGRVDVSIVTSGHDVADARLHREVAALVRAGLRVEVLGLGEASAGPPDAVVRARPRRSGVRRALDAALLPWRASGR